MLYLVVEGGEMSGFALISCDSQGTTDFSYRNLAKSAVSLKAYFEILATCWRTFSFVLFLRLQYSRRLSPCGHLAITDTPQFADKSS